MHMDRFCRQLGDAGDEIGKEQEAGCEARVGNVDMVEIDIGFDAVKVAFHICKICGPE